MEENKNLVISYSYYYHGKYSPKETAEEREVDERIQEILQELMSKGSISNSLSCEFDELTLKQCTFLREREITVYKEYPEFLIKDFKTKEELLDFIDEDEPNINIHENICFENVPDCLKKFGLTNKLIDCEEYKRYILARHGKGEDD